jgi:hypothetical protein
MPVIELRENDLEQECSHCSARRVIGFGDIAIGVDLLDRLDGRIIVLPECPCGAREYLVRREDAEAHPAPGSHAHLHGLLVAALHARLVRSGRIAPGLEKEKTAPRESAAALERWFQGGLRLSAPREDSV